VTADLTAALNTQARSNPSDPRQVQAEADGEALAPAEAHASPRARLLRYVHIKSLTVDKPGNSRHRMWTVLARGDVFPSQGCG
jgi:hypothetical protein